MMRPGAARIGRAIAGVAALAAGGYACGGSDAPGTPSTPTTPDPVVGSVRISPSSASVFEGQSTQLSAGVFSTTGSAMTASVQWAVEHTSIATVDQSGRVVGVREGTTRVLASAGEVTGAATLFVRPPSIVRVEVTPESLRLEIGEDAGLQASSVNANGERDRAGTTISWESADPAVATVDASGRVVAVAAGETSITARATITSGSYSSSASASVPVVVVSSEPASVEIDPASARIDVGGTASWTATVRTAAGDVVADPDLVWSVDDAAVASLSATSGATVTTTGLAAGETVVRVRVGSLEASGPITVDPRPVSSVVVTPAGASLQVGATLAYSATVSTSAGPVTDRPVSWSSSDAAIATIDANGVVTGVAPGEVRIEATAGGVTGSTTLTVVVAAVESVVVTAPADRVEVGASIQLTATVQAGGQVVTDRPVTWNSLNGAVAAVDADGRVTGVSAGTTVISASSEGVTGSVTITVESPAIASVTVTAPAATLLERESFSLSATALDTRGAAVAASFTWSTSDATVGSVDANGTFLAESPGTVIITATADGVGGQIQITVTARAVGSVKVVDAAGDTITFLETRIGRAAEVTVLVMSVGGVPIDREVTHAFPNNQRPDPPGPEIVRDVEPDETERTRKRRRVRGGQAGSAEIRFSAAGVDGDVISVSVLAPDSIVPSVQSGATVVGTAPLTLQAAAGDTIVLTATAWDPAGAQDTQPFIWRTSSGAKVELVGETTIDTNQDGPVPAFSGATARFVVKSFTGADVELTVRNLGTNGDAVSIFVRAPT